MLTEGLAPPRDFSQQFLRLPCLLFQPREHKSTHSVPDRISTLSPTFMKLHFCHISNQLASLTVVDMMDFHHKWLQLWVVCYLDHYIWLTIKKLPDRPTRLHCVLFHYPRTQSVSGIGTSPPSKGLDFSHLNRLRWSLLRESNPHPRTYEILVTPCAVTMVTLTGFEPVWSDRKSNILSR